MTLDCRDLLEDLAEVELLVNQEHRDREVLSVYLAQVGRREKRDSQDLLTEVLNTV